jgi:hypothetical protein
MASSREDQVAWEPVPVAQFNPGSSGDQTRCGACRGEGLMAGGRFSSEPTPALTEYLIYARR